MCKRLILRQFFTGFRISKVVPKGLLGLKQAHEVKWHGTLRFSSRSLCHPRHLLPLLASSALDPPKSGLRRLRGTPELRTFHTKKNAEVVLTLKKLMNLQQLQ